MKREFSKVAVDSRTGQPLKLKVITHHTISYHIISYYFLYEYCIITILIIFHILPSLLKSIIILLILDLYLWITFLWLHTNRVVDKWIVAGGNCSTHLVCSSPTDMCHHVARLGGNIVKEVYAPLSSCFCYYCYSVVRYILLHQKNRECDMTCVNFLTYVCRIG